MEEKYSLSPVSGLDNGTGVCKAHRAGLAFALEKSGVGCCLARKNAPRFRGLGVNFCAPTKPIQNYPISSPLNHSKKAA